MTKRVIAAAVLLLVSFAGMRAYGQTPTYLSTAYRPVESHAYTKVQDMLFGTMYMGGVPYKNGFHLFTTYGPTEHGYAEFSLKGRFRTFTFIVGCSQADSPGTDKAVLAIRGDGRKLMERMVAEYDVPQRISLDVTGIDRLRFEITMNDVRIGIAEPILYTASQTPRETGKLSLATGKPLMLVRDLRPYKINNYHKCVSQNEKFRDLRSIKISGKTYTDGLRLDATIQLIGQDERRTFFNLEGKYSTLEFIAGPQDSDDGKLGVAWLSVKGDERILLEEEVGEGNLAKKFTVNVKGCRWISIESQQSQGSSALAVVNAMVYPEGYDIAGSTEGELLDASAEIKALPDVCKLVSNIQPYAVGGGISRENMVYDGSTDFRTFSMGGVRFNEGLIFQSATNVLDDNTRSHAVFNVEGEFDHVSFTTGWISKCGVLKNDTLRVYADNRVVFNQPMTATSPNQHYTVPINRCRKLMFEKRGIVSLNHPAFGVADIVLYRGKPVANDLFVHPRPECPDEIDLIDLGKPYIHYVSPLKDYQDRIFKDGSTKKNYFTMPNGERIYKGFVLQTSVHFDLEMGPTGTPAAGVTAGMMGSAIMVGAVGGATITAISPFGALIALAAGGTAHESSCAAFNTWGQYDYITFTVAAVPNNSGDTVSLKSNPIEHLLIGADGNVVANLELYGTMNPTTYTIPLNRAEQLMFWLQCGEWWSEKYVFYNLKLSRGEHVDISMPEVAEMDSKPTVAATAEPYILPIVSAEMEKVAWDSPKRCGKDAIDNYFSDCDKARHNIEEFFAYAIRDYRSEARHVRSSDGTLYRAVSIVSSVGEKYGISAVIAHNEELIGIIKKYQRVFTMLGMGKANASLDLPSLGFRAFEYGKHIKAASKMISAYKTQLEIFRKDRELEIELLKTLLANGVTVDGVQSDDENVFIR